MQSYAIEGLVTPGSLLSVSNLSYRDHGHRLPTASATDITTFSQSPQDIHLKNALAELKEKIPVCLRSYLLCVILYCSLVPRPPQAFITCSMKSCDKSLGRPGYEANSIVCHTLLCVILYCVSYFVDGETKVPSVIGR